MSRCLCAREESKCILGETEEAGVFLIFILRSDLPQHVISLMFSRSPCLPTHHYLSESIGEQQ